MKDTINQLTAYDCWATRQMNRFLSQLDEAKLTMEIASSFSSLQKTVFHIKNAQALWLKRFHGESTLGWQENDFAGWDTLWKQWEQIAEEFRAYATWLSEVELLEEFDYQNTKGQAFRQPRYEAILHVVNHGTYHRGQLVTMAREAGVTEGIPATDIIVYFRTVGS